MTETDLVIKYILNVEDQRIKYEEQFLKEEEENRERLRRKKAQTIERQRNRRRKRTRYIHLNQPVSTTIIQTHNTTEIEELERDIKNQLRAIFVGLCLIIVFICVVAFAGTSHVEEKTILETDSFNKQTTISVLDTVAPLQQLEGQKKEIVDEVVINEKKTRKKSVHTKDVPKQKKERSIELTDDPIGEFVL